MANPRPASESDRVSGSAPAVREVQQLGLWGTLGMFAWPAAWYTFVIYVIGRAVSPFPDSTPTWVLLGAIALGSGAELVAGLWLLRREGYRLAIADLKQRIRLTWPKGWKSWALVTGVFVVGMGLSMAMGGANKGLASVPGFVPPDWWPAASNPLVPVTSAADAFPDVTLAGNYLFVVGYLLIGLVFNIFGEELYYRGYLLPRMRGVFGRWDWVANGVLFTLKHVYQRWLYPGILIGGLGFAFAAGPLGSLPLAMVFHWAGNFLFQTVFLVMALFG